MKQKFEDLVLLIKRDRKWQAIVLILAIGLTWAALHKPSKPQPGRGITRPQALSTGTSNPDEQFRDLMASVRGDLEGLKEATKNTTVDLQNTKKEIEENNARVSEIFKKVLTRIEESNTASRVSPAGGGSANIEDVDPGNPDAPMASINPADAGIAEMTMPPAASVAPPPQAGPQKTAVVAAGDHVRVKLIGAVNASTDGTPYPVLFKLVSDVRGPNNSNLPLGEAIMIAAAQGSLTDARALFRLSSLNIAYPDGRRNVVEVDGWVVGEDGINGMEGVLIDPIGEEIAATAMSSFVEGLGEGLASRQTTTRAGILGTTTVDITGNEMAYAEGKGASQGAKAWSRIIQDRASKLTPLVQVLSGREATAVFAKSFKVQGLIEAYRLNEDSYSSVD